MSRDRTLYRGFQVYRRSGNSVIFYRCFEQLPGGGFAVQSADHVHLPVDPEATADHERRFWELLIDMDPAERQGGLFSTVEEAIAAFDEGFAVDDDAVAQAIDARLRRLLQVHWGSADDWQPRVKLLLLEFAARAQPLLPDTRSIASPVDSAFREAVQSRLAADERARVAGLTTEVVASGRSRNETPMEQTQHAVSLVLALATLVERGDLAPHEDPGEPLTEIFEAGYELTITHEGISAIHGAGISTIKAPTLAEIAARQQRR